MPLHLLGKKSWNVYNKDNIERVRRDEASAKAAEEAAEQRMQEVDAARRLAILRGETPPPIEQEEAAAADPEASPSRRLGTGRRPRKRHGEDDTDFELRIAAEREATVRRAAADARRATSSAPIVDRRGHIDLFGGDVDRSRHTEKNEDAERDKRRKEREYEDQYTMRFANAGGQPGLDAPWYAAEDGSTAQKQVAKNVWGRDDPKRKDREAKRTVASDPLAMMKQGAARVRELRQERGKLEEERDRELRQMRREEERRERRGQHRAGRRRSRSPREEGRQRSGYGRSAGRSRDEEHRHRDRSGDGSRDDRRRRHRSRSRDRGRHGRHEDEKRHK
ncbi:homocitrate synthase [Cordyceps militaris]|uniref:Homocitrate synthase n=1 Tax=Cordyceps militaris TaxID=73501 RepID=A0A2H4SSW2_CORMI|nr:homocitrate synthase [Cordyceps militaris]